MEWTVEDRLTITEEGRRVLEEIKRRRELEKPGTCSECAPAVRTVDSLFLIADTVSDYLKDRARR